MKDYYKILGIDKSASETDIKRAYRRLASQFHPDKGGDTSKFQEIEEAYRILSDPAQRSIYDNPGIKININQNSPGFDFNEIFEMFGARFNQPHMRTRRQTRMQLWIDLKDVCTGGPRTVSLFYQNNNISVQIELLPGIEDGDTVRYPNLLPDNNDLLVTFKIKQQARWQRNGTNVLYDLDVDIWTLIVGGEVEVCTLADSTISVTIPERTVPGTNLRIKGQGLPDRTNKSVRGDMMIRVQPVFPNHISDRLLAAIKEEINR